jgi:enoyl-CoA hydratase/carnithine racemase
VAGDYGDILFDVAGGTATVTLNRPARRNAWTLRMAAELNDAMRRCAVDDDIRVVIVTGADRWFSVGADLGQGSILHPGESGVQPDLGPFFSPRQVPKPVIAAINGDAVGAGTTYPLHCDVRIVAEDARMGFAFVRRGVIPEMGLHWIAPRVIGIAAAAELILTGRIFDGREAVALGVCSKAVPADGVLVAAQTLAAEIVTAVAPLSAAAAKRLLWDGLERSWVESFEREMATFEWLASQPDAAEGVASFLEKRPPRWQGRASQLPEQPPP